MFKIGKVEENEWIINEHNTVQLPHGMPDQSRKFWKSARPWKMGKSGKMDELDRFGEMSALPAIVV